jgi:hypothetical protein
MEMDLTFHKDSPFEDEENSKNKEEEEKFEVMISTSTLCIV